MQQEMSIEEVIKERTTKVFLVFISAIATLMFLPYKGIYNLLVFKEALKPMGENQRIVIPDLELLSVLTYISFVFL